MMEHNKNNPSGAGDDEKKRRDMDKFLKKYWSLRAEMAKLKEESKIYYARRMQFLNRFIPELQELITEFYPEYKATFPVFRSDLNNLASLLYDEVVNLCYHYLEDKPEYYHGLHEVKFEITTTIDLIPQLSHAPRYPEILKVAESRYENEYVNEFWRGCYEKHIHLLLKKNAAGLHR